MKRIFFNTYAIWGLLVVFAIGWHFVLQPFSPSHVKSDIYAVKFFDGYEKLYQIQGDQMSCLPIADLLEAHCVLDFEGKKLEVGVRYQNERRGMAEACTISYGGEEVSCQTGWDYENPAPSVIIEDDLGGSVERFAELRQENPLLYWSEERWVQLVRLFSGILAILSAMIFWGSASKQNDQPISTDQRLLRSALNGLLVWFILSFGIGVTVGDFLTTSNSWQLVRIMAFAGGVLSAIWKWYRYSGNVRLDGRWRRGLYSLAGGAFVLVTMHLLLIIDLLSLGFID